MQLLGTEDEQFHLVLIIKERNVEWRHIHEYEMRVHDSLYEAFVKEHTH